MKIDSFKIHGQKFYQDSLTHDFQNAIGGQRFIFKSLLIVLTIIFATISGCLAGLLGGFISFSIFFPKQEPAPMVFFYIALTVATWVIQSIRHGFFRGLRDATLVAVIGSILVVVLFQDHFLFLIILFFTLLAISAAFLSLLSGSLSFSIIFALFYRKQSLKAVVYGILITFIAIKTTSLIGISYLDNHREITWLLSELVTFELVKFFSGLLAGIIVVGASLAITRCKDKYSKHFLFLREWALALGSWGGTSFYNLDLSNVNFRNAYLANTDLRAKKLYRTCFQGVKGLERARVDSRYLDLENLKVQKLLTRAYSEDKDFSHLNLRGAYLQNAIMREFNLEDADLTGADLRGADLRDIIMVCTKVIDVDFTGADLTGVCIQDWSVNSQTDFTEVQCDYVYRRLDENGERTDRFPTNRNFEPREFESLYQEVENVVELIFKEGDNWQAALFSLKKLQIEDEEMGLQLKGIERRGDRWVVKVTYNQNYSKQEVERVLDSTVEEMKHQLAAKERQINRLLGIMEDQAEALNKLSKQPFGNSFVITGGTITNLVGSGNIDYDEASNEIRSIVANADNPAQVTTTVQRLLEQFQRQNVAIALDQQAELIQQLILDEAQKNPDFQQSFVQQGQQIADALPEGAISTAIKKAIAQLT